MQLRFLWYDIRKSGKYDANSVDWKQERQSKTAHNILREGGQVNGGVGFMKNNRKTHFIKTYMGQKIVKGYSRLFPEGTRQIKKKEKFTI